MNDVIQIAKGINKDFNPDLPFESTDRMVELYQLIRQKGTDFLIEMNDPEDLHVIGVALAHIALSLEKDHHKKICATASEESFFCLYRSYLNGQNIYALPPLFSLITLKPELIHRHFLAFSCKAIKQESYKDVASVLEKKLSQLPSFRKQIYDYIEYSAYYISSFFYDIERAEYTVSTDNSPLLPTVKALHNHILPLYHRYNHTWLISEGGQHTEGVYWECYQSIKQAAR